MSFVRPALHLLILAATWRNSANRKQRLFELVKNQERIQMAHSIPSRLLSKHQAQIFICCELKYGCYKGIQIIWRDSYPKSPYRTRQLRARVGRCKDGAATRKHSRQLRRHHKISGARALRKQMDVRQVQQIIKAIGGLERQKRDVRQTLRLLSKNLPIRTLAAKDKS